jgi:hypothetical protein
MTPASPHRSFARFFVLAIAATALLAASPARAQIDLDPGLRSGATVLSAGDPVGGLSAARADFTIGAFLTIDPDGPFALQPEVNYVKKPSASLRASATGLDVGYRQQSSGFIDVPVLVKYQFNPEAPLTPTVFLGPSFGSPTEARRAEFGAIAGTGLNVEVDDGKISALTIEARFRHSLRARSTRGAFLACSTCLSIAPGAERTTVEYRPYGFTFTLGVSFQNEPIDPQ